MSSVGHPRGRNTPQEASWPAEQASGRAESRHVGRAVINGLRSIFVGTCKPRYVRATDLFPGFDDKQLRDIGLRVDQIVLVDALCREDWHGSCEASAEQAPERRTPIEAKTTWRTAEGVLVIRRRNTS
jgi:hypothetical protein